MDVFDIVFMSRAVYGCVHLSVDFSNNWKQCSRTHVGKEDGLYVDVNERCSCRCCSLSFPSHVSVLTFHAVVGSDTTERARRKEKK